jgi:D-tyrosyl-tRNA(Tyr) deacylase
VLGRHEATLDEQLAQAAARDPPSTGVALIRENGVEVLFLDVPVAQEQHAERRPRVRSGFHLGSYRRASLSSLQRENGRVRAVVQRVREASVEIDGEVVASCGRGLLVLLGVGADDGSAEAERLAGKIARLRIFEDADGRFDRALDDVGGEALVVSQFTLLADTRKGNRPSFTAAAPAQQAEPLYEGFCAALEQLGVPVGRGVFGARMDVSLVNDGPVTIIVDV